MPPTHLIPLAIDAPFTLHESPYVYPIPELLISVTVVALLLSEFTLVKFQELTDVVIPPRTTVPCDKSNVKVPPALTVN